MNITLALTYYDNPDMLRKQLMYWQEYGKDLADKVNIIIVDDGSPNHPAKEVLYDAEPLNIDISLYRIKQDIFQNVAGARNLAFTKSSNRWVWNIDMDHVISYKSMGNLLDMHLESGCYYQPYRFRMLDMEHSEPMDRHSDTFIMERDLFWEVGGYNEDYIQYYYNGSLSLFRRQLKRSALSIELGNVWTLYFGPGVIADASPLNGSEKKKLEFHGIVDAMMNSKTKNNPLRFDWEEIEL